MAGIPKVLKMKTVSVIIPTYNRESTVRRAINSVLEQDYKNLEIIVIDDGSTDATAEVIKEIQSAQVSAEKIVHYFRQKNQGACVARNFGMKQAVGDYLMFLDSDDFIRDDYIATQVESIEAQQAECSICDFEATIESSGEVRYFDNGRHPQDFIRKLVSPSVSTVFMRRDSIPSHLLWNEKLKSLQDLDFIFRYFLSVKKYSYVNKPLFKYILHNGERISDNYTEGLQYSILKESMWKYVNEDSASLVSNSREIVKAYIWSLRKHQAKNIVVRITPSAVKQVIKRMLQKHGLV